MVTTHGPVTDPVIQKLTAEYTTDELRYLCYAAQCAYSTAPSSPPTSFHVTVLSCNAIRAEWRLPIFGDRNGVIRGYVVFVQPSAGGEELAMNITGNQTTEFIIENLTPSTSYIVSVLAHTVGNGPRTIHLTVTTNPENICKCKQPYSPSPLAICL